MGKSSKPRPWPSGDIDPQSWPVTAEPHNLLQVQNSSSGLRPPRGTGEGLSSQQVTIAEDYYFPGFAPVRWTAGQEKNVGGEENPGEPLKLKTCFLLSGIDATLPQRSTQ